MDTTAAPEPSARRLGWKIVGDMLLLWPLVYLLLLVDLAASEDLAQKIALTAIGAALSYLLPRMTSDDIEAWRAARAFESPR